MRSAIIGNGFIAQKHKEAIKKMGWDYIGAYDILPSRSEINFKDLEKADIIHICTPNAFHIPYIEQFKHKKLIVEKPISINLNNIPDIDACVCFQRRFDKQAIKMKELCDKLKPNKIIANIFVPRDNFYWECWRGDISYSGGGALMNIGIHYIDLLQWWLGNNCKIIESKIGFFNRVIDESSYVKLLFGKTEVILHLNARHNQRKIEYIAFWQEKYFLYDTDEATHFELFDGWTKGNYVNTKEAQKSLKLILDIYEMDKINKNNLQIHK